MNDLVSIIMPSYNTADYIADSIQSVINQTYTFWELLIIDDCSSDTSVEVIRSFSDSRIKLLINDSNSGAAVSRNYGLREAKGRWIAFLDSDDLWKPNKLESQIEFMETNGYTFSYTNYEEIDMRGNLTGTIVSGPSRISKTGFNNYCWPGCLTVMYDQNVVGLIQIVDLKKNNDYAMWLKVCRRADCYLLNELLASYRSGRKGSISSNSVLTMISWHYKLFRLSEAQKPVHAVFSTIRNMIFGFYKKVRYVRT